MSFASKRNRAERAVELSAASCFGAAVGTAMLQLAPLSGGWLAIAALAGGAVAGWAAFVLIARSASRAHVMASFEPAAFADCPDELLLDRPLEPVAVESRVTALFAADPAEMIARIGTFLDSGAGASRRGGPQFRADASAELHAALAEIRHSLGRG